MRNLWWTVANTMGFPVKERITIIYHSLLSLSLSQFLSFFPFLNLLRILSSLFLYLFYHFISQSVSFSPIDALFHNLSFIFTISLSLYYFIFKYKTVKQTSLELMAKPKAFHRKKMLINAKIFPFYSIFQINYRKKHKNVASTILLAMEIPSQQFTDHVLTAIGPWLFLWCHTGLWWPNIESTSCCLISLLHLFR